jgi:ABC-type transporter Mla subunit MlaD
MKTAMNALICMALVAVIVLCFSVAHQVTTVGKHLSNTLMNVNVTIKKVDAEVDEMHRLTVEAALTATEARKASVQEEQFLTTSNKQVAQVLDNLNATLVSVRAASDQAARSASDVASVTSTTIQNVQPVLEAATSELKTLQTTTESLNTLVTDPHLAATVANVDETTQHLNKTAAETESWMHGILHPSWASRIKSWLIDAATVLK